MQDSGLINEFVGKLRQGINQCIVYSIISHLSKFQPWIDLVLQKVEVSYNLDFIWRKDAKSIMFENFK